MNMKLFTTPPPALYSCSSYAPYFAGFQYMGASI